MNLKQPSLNTNKPNLERQPSYNTVSVPSRLSVQLENNGKKKKNKRLQQQQHIFFLNKKKKYFCVVAIIIYFNILNI